MQSLEQWGPRGGTENELYNEYKILQLCLFLYTHNTLRLPLDRGHDAE